MLNISAFSNGVPFVEGYISERTKDEILNFECQGTWNHRPVLGYVYFNGQSTMLLKIEKEN